MLAVYMSETEKHNQTELRFCLIESFLISIVRRELILIKVTLEAGRIML